MRKWVVLFGEKWYALNMSKKIYVEPSIFAGDFAKLGDEAKRAEDAGADAIHFDIMDGHLSQI